MSCTDLASQATPLDIGGWLVAQANVVAPSSSSSFSYTLVRPSARPHVQEKGNVNTRWKQKLTLHYTHVSAVMEGGYMMGNNEGWVHPLRF
jgi:hypothetical protein